MNSQCKDSGANLPNWCALAWQSHCVDWTLDQWLDRANDRLREEGPAEDASAVSQYARLTLLLELLG